MKFLVDIRKFSRRFANLRQSQKMSEIKDLILSDNNLLKFFEGNPLLEMLQRELTHEKINSEILSLDPNCASEEKHEKKVTMTKMDERKNLIVKVLLQFARKLKEICENGLMNSADEHSYNDESFPINPEVRNLSVFAFS